MTSDYEANLNRLVRRDFDLVYGIGFLLKDAIETVADKSGYYVRTCG